MADNQTTLEEQFTHRRTVHGHIVYLGLALCIVAFMAAGIAYQNRGLFYAC